MNADTSQASTIHSFIAATRRRLWATEAVRHGYGLLWQSGVLLMILAGVHLLSSSLPASVPIIGVALLALLALIRIVLHRPAVLDCAVRADQEFGGKALMTTALECLRRPANAEEFASSIVLRQARDAAVQWRPKVSKLFRAPRAGTGVLAMIPVFLAVMLLSLPGAEVDGDIPETIDEASMIMPGDRDRDIVADGGGVAAIRRALNDDEAREGRRAVEDQREGNSETLVPYQGAEANIEGAQLINLEQIRSEQGAASASGDSEDLPGDALPASRASTRAAMSPAQFRSREIIELQRTGDVVAAGEIQRKTFRDIGKRIPNSQIEVLPVAAPADNLHRAMLSPAQAAYASRYLAEIGEANE